jgi:hypothetical protein
MFLNNFKKLKNLKSAQTWKSSCWEVYFIEQGKGEKQTPRWNFLDQMTSRLIILVARIKVNDNIFSLYRNPVSLSLLSQKKIEKEKNKVWYQNQISTTKETNHLLTKKNWGPN